MDRGDHDPPARPAARASGADELASRFDDVLRSIAAAAGAPEDFHRGVADLTAKLAARKPELAERWQAFVTRKWDAAGAEFRSFVKDAGLYPTSVSGRATETLRRPRAALRRASPTTPDIDLQPRGDPDARRLRQPVGRERPSLHDASRPPTPLELHRASGERIGTLWLQGGPGPATSSGPLPPGWVVETAWGGPDGTHEVVYNPRRHQVMVTADPGPAIASALKAAGWEHHATSGVDQLWIRDRTAATQAALARLDQAAAIGPDGPELRPAVGLAP